MEKINYLNQYGRNNLTEKPLEYYLEAFEKTDPYKISRRLGIPYDPPRKEFTFYFLGQTYIARCSDFQINPVDSEDNLFGRNPKARILLLRYLLYSTVYFPDGEFKSYREFPSGELYYDVFRGRCIQRLLRIIEQIHQHVIYNFPIVHSTRSCFSGAKKLLRFSVYEAIVT